MIHVEKVYTKPTATAIETLTLKVSDGLIQLYSEDNGRDLGELIKGLLLQIPDQLDPNFKVLAKRKVETQFVLKVETDIFDNDDPDNVTSVTLYLIGRHKRTIHGDQNTIYAYHEAEIRGLPQFSDIAKRM